MIKKTKQKKTADSVSLKGTAIFRKRELVDLLSLPSWCLVIVVWLFLVVPWVCLQFVIVVCPDHTHYFKACKSILHAIIKPSNL